MTTKHAKTQLPEPDPTDLDVDADETYSPREVELYVGFPIGEELRDGLQLFLDAHPELDEEATFARMLALGLRQIEQDGGAHHHDAALRRTIRKIEASQRRLLLALACGVPPRP